MSKYKDKLGDLERHISATVRRYPELKVVEKSICDAYLLLEKSFQNKGKLLIAGNGGSASDADHIVGELMKGFMLKRRGNEEFKKNLIEVDKSKGKELSEKLQGALPAISLVNHNSLNTAFHNDVDGNICFAQQVNGYGNEGDVFLGISTSGNSMNILYAAVTAKAKGMKVIGLTGRDGGELDQFADVNIVIPEKETFMIQELHLPVYHCICLMLEEKFYGTGTQL